MSAFADSSALVKLYFDEAGHDAVRSIDALLTVSGLGWVEVSSAIWRKAREGSITAGQASVLQRRADADWSPLRPRFAVIPISRAVTRTANRVVAVHALRSLEAIQLGSAMVARDAVPEIDTFLAYDDRLRDAAATEGFRPGP